MGTTYTEANTAVRKLFDQLLAAEFPDLLEAAVTFSILMARNSEGVPVKCHGAPAVAKVKVNGLQDRVEGKADVTITIDEHRWDDANERERQAICFHELTHCELKRGEDGAIETDDAGRPKIKLRPDDWLLSGFHRTIEKFGAAAVEYRGLREVASQLVQKQLWGEDW